jgi:hypothetical protein
MRISGRLSIVATSNVALLHVAAGGVGWWWAASSGSCGHGHVLFDHECATTALVRPGSAAVASDERRCP